MSDIKYIFELTAEEVKLLAYGAMPQELKEKLMEIAYHIDDQERVKKVLAERNNIIEDKKEQKIDKPIVNPKPAPKITLEEIRKTNHNAYELWTKEEEKELRKEFWNGRSIQSLSKHFQRSPGGIRFRLIKLELIKDDTAIFEKE